MCSSLGHENIWGKKYFKNMKGKISHLVLIRSHEGRGGGVRKNDTFLRWPRVVLKHLL